MFIASGISRVHAFFGWMASYAVWTLAFFIFILVGSFALYVHIISVENRSLYRNELLCFCKSYDHGIYCNRAFYSQEYL